jgi:uncharacterized protein YjbJ (UPF0337 family)
MNDDLPELRWRQVETQTREWWGKLTDVDLETIAGKSQRLADALVARYGYIRQHAEAQSIRWMRKHREEPGDGL